jgi:tripartite-type tricarboxylate transporter receptor subunit TctC
VIENKPGAALMLAAQAVATAPADGHTLLVSTSTAMAINPMLFKKVNYDHLKDFAPIAYYLKAPFILVVNPNMPVKSVADLIKHAKESAKPLTFASTGPGTGLHLSAEYMKQRYGLQMTHVPYRGTPQMMADLTAGHVDFAFAEVGATLPLVRDGKLRALAVSSSNRMPSLPDVPPFGEAAGVNDFEVVSWHMLYAPANTPKDVVARLHGEMKKIMAAPDMRQKVLAVGLLPVDTPPLDGIDRFLSAEREKWGALVKSLGLAGTM